MECSNCGRRFEPEVYWTHACTGEDILDPPFFKTQAIDDHLQTVLGQPENRS